MILVEAVLTEPDEEKAIATPLQDLPVVEMALNGNPFGNPRVTNPTITQRMSLKIMVGERGFEPPTPWSRTRCSTRLSHSPTCLQPAPQLGTVRRATHGRELSNSAPSASITELHPGTWPTGVPTQRVWAHSQLGILRPKP